MTSPSQGHDDGLGELTDSLVQTSFVVMAALSRIGAENDLSLTQLRVLGILRDRRLRMSALADYLGLERSTMSGLVDRAERRGLLQRAPSDSDRRAVDVLLTPDGTALAERVFSDVVAWLSTLTVTMPAPERATLQGSLRRLLG